MTAALTQEELAWATAYVQTVNWTYAKSVPEARHWYKMQPKQDSAEREDYDRMSLLIRRAGDVRPWQIPGTERWLRYRYLSVGDHDYWATTRPGMYSLNRRVHVEPEAPLLV